MRTFSDSNLGEFWESKYSVEGGERRFEFFEIKFKKTVFYSSEKPATGAENVCVLGVWGEAQKKFDDILLPPCFSRFPQQGGYYE